MTAVGSRSKISDTNLLLLLALLRLLVYALTNGQYGFHRDELALLDHAQSLQWGYVAYPPLTPFIGRIATEMFGLWLPGIRFFTALAQCMGMVLAGLMARELGGGRRAQVVTAVATAIALMSLIMGALFQYISFDYLWWVLIAYLMIKLLNTEDPRWWLAIGATIGLGMLTKYTMAFYVMGLVAAVLLTPMRRYLRSPWLWGGVALSLLIFLPNLLWQWQNDFISLEFLSAIHARDVAIGRADGFISQQFYVNANPFTLPLWLAGLFYFATRPRYRPLAWLFGVTQLTLLLEQGRFYYAAPLYPMLLAAGSVWWEGWLADRPPSRQKVGWRATAVALTLGGIIGVLLMLPVAPVNSALWHVTSSVHDNFVEQLGWTELVDTVAQIVATLPPDERVQTGILAGNYGEAGAINLLGRERGLPMAISGVNSYWYRGYGDPPPQTLIVLGFEQEVAAANFEECKVVGENTNRYGVENEESRLHRDILLCRNPRFSWPELWPQLQSFG